MVFHKVWCCPLGTRGGRFFVTGKICSAWQKLFAYDPLVTKQLIKTNKNTNKKLSTLVLVFGLIAASAMYYLISCGSSSSSLMSLEASSPQHKSRCSCRQHSYATRLLSAPFINAMLFPDPHSCLQVSKIKWKQIHNYKKLTNLGFLLSPT